MMTNDIALSYLFDENRSQASIMVRAADGQVLSAYISGKDVPALYEALTQLEARAQRAETERDDAIARAEAAEAERDDASEHAAAVEAELAALREGSDEIVWPDPIEMEEGPVIIEPETIRPVFPIGDDDDDIEWENDGDWFGEAYDFAVRIKAERDAAVARAEAAEATIKRLDDLGRELATPSVWLRGGHSIEVIIHEYFRLKAELATLREQLAAHEWRPLPPPPDAD